MSNNLTPFQFEITKKNRNKTYGHKSIVIWITGLSGSGKSTLANTLEKQLFEVGIKTMILDGDNVRNGLNNNLGFSPEDRTENIRRIAETAKLLVESGTVVIASFISPFEENRRTVKNIVGENNYYEIHIDTQLEICEKRDPKGLYQKARNGEIKEFTGVSSPYETPKNPNFSIDSASSDYTLKLTELISVLRKKSLQMGKYFLNHIDELESEAIFILREVVAKFKNPVLLFSGGKDSIVLTHLAKKAFYPGKIPFSLLHIDTGHNFPETIQFRDDLSKKLDIDLLVGSVQESIDKGRVQEEKGKQATRNILQTTTLLDFIESSEIDCAIGGARRDEEKSRAKERFFSHRDDFGQWDPKNQRPELWSLFNSKHHIGEHFRVFPISNWTELDIWNYILRENIEIPSLYFAHEREVIWRNNTWIPNSKFLTLDKSEIIEQKKIRFRTLGDITITGGIESEADSLMKIVAEVATMKETERGNRADDKRSSTAMEDRKKEGYF